jgi:hypothetical protein
MDFERAEIKTLFYDYPVEQAVNVMLNTHGSHADYLETFPQIARWRESAFSISEMQALKRKIEGTQSGNGIASIIEALSEVASQFLTLSSDGEPRVQYDNLLRWQELVSFVGEDLFTIPYVAQIDYQRNKKREVFLWSDVLPHDYRALNEVLDKGLTDVHAHFQASVDIFHLNWVAMMNHIDTSRLLEMEKRIKAYQELSVKVPQTVKADTKDYTIVQLVVAAAYLRVKLWQALNHSIDKRDISAQRIADILGDSVIMTTFAKREILNELSLCKLEAMRDAHDEVTDYLILDTPINQKHKDNIYTVYAGERTLMYEYFYKIHSTPKEVEAYLPMFYLYLLIKNHVRREFVQNNHLIGFENFQLYQERKRTALKGTPIADNYPRYVLQTTIRKGKNDHLEGRIAPKKAKSYYEFEKNHIEEFQGCTTSVYTPKRKVRPIYSLSLVYHFIKKNDFKEGLSSNKSLRTNISRYAEFRKQLHRQSEYIIRLYNAQRCNKKTFAGVPKLTGIDAASSELYCRPEVFAHAFRYCRAYGLQNQTYHVGEDFLDLSDGLRAIDEVVQFLELDSHCRLGHALALGTNAAKYYNRRHFHSLIPRQNHLDNCVWLYIRGNQWAGRNLTSPMSTWLYEQASREYAYLGYERIAPFDIYIYWNSILLRGIDVDFIQEDEKGFPPSIWKQTSFQHNLDIDNALLNKECRTLYIAYHTEGDIKEKGIEVEDVKWPSDCVRLVCSLQRKMINLLAEMQIAIESNPTSNYKIGCFERYDEHPILQFYPIAYKPSTPIVNTSVNTDDRGIFSTSIAREFSLLSLALRKMKHQKTGERLFSDHQILEYIEGIRKNGESQCFTLQPDEYEYYKMTSQKSE